MITYAITSSCPGLQTKAMGVKFITTSKEYRRNKAAKKFRFARKYLIIASFSHFQPMAPDELIKEHHVVLKHR